jgi:hypothetical protein
MKALMLVHLAAAMVLLGSACHAAIAAWQVRSGKIGKYTLFRRYCSIVLVAYPVVFLLGSIIYPAFRVDVRTEFDANLPWATGLFEIKEHVTALALPLVAIQWILSRDRGIVPIGLQLAIALVLSLVVLGAGTTGALLVSLRSL